MNHLLHLERSTDVDGFLTFVELLFHPIIRPKPVASGLCGRTTPPSVRATGADVVDDGIKSWQGIIIRGTEAEDEGSWNTRAEEAVEFRDFLPPAAAFFFWSTTIEHGVCGI